MCLSVAGTTELVLYSHQSDTVLAYLNWSLQNRISVPAFWGCIWKKGSCCLHSHSEHWSRELAASAELDAHLSVA